MHLLRRLAAAVLAVLVLAGAAAAEESSLPLPEPVSVSLYGLVQAAREQRLPDPQAAVEPLLEFTSSQRGSLDNYCPLEHEGASGACSSFVIDVPLEKILAYGYDPDAPAYAVMPSSLRYTKWYPGSDIMQAEKLSELLDGLTEPVVLGGREYEEITPDIFSGAYYSYDLDRLLVLTRYHGRGALVSVAAQDGPSSVGRKGAVVGEDSDWNYVYSEEPGMTMKALGWMDTYMYDSFSVTVFLEHQIDPDKTLVAVYKWLRAGWMKMNVVKTSHIEEGLARFAKSFKRVMEDPDLPGKPELVRKYSELKAMDEQQLLSLAEPHVQHIRTLDDAPVLKKKPFAELLEQNRYLEEMSREELIGLIIREYLKQSLSNPS